MLRILLACGLLLLACAPVFGQPDDDDDGPPRRPPQRGAAADADGGDPDYAAALRALSAPTPIAAAVQLALPINRAVLASPRAQRLKSMTFDRRPGAMLMIWAPKPKPDTEPGVKKPKKTPDEEKLDAEMEAFHRAVTLGDWPRVKSYLATLHPLEAKLAYGQILRSLATAPIDPEVQRRITAGARVPRHILERNVFFTDDLMGLAACSPGPLSKDSVRSLAGMLRQALHNGVVIEHIVDRLGLEVKKPAASAILTRRQCARLLADAGEVHAMGVFLPGPDEALKDKDLEALNLLARHYLEQHQREKKSVHLEKAWQATLNILALDGPQEEKEQALRRAVDMAPRIKEELGQNWLDQSFTKHPERGMDILATLGTNVAKGFQTHPHDPSVRLKSLQLQKTAVDALLKVAPAKADDWKGTLTLLAANWLKEADYSRIHDRSTGAQARMRRDYFGNFYFVNPDEDMQERQAMAMRSEELPTPIVTPEILRCAPPALWLERVDAGLKPRIAIVLAQLHLKVAEETKAFPHIETLAVTHPEQAKELIKEFLKVWTRNHDPNAEKNMGRNSWIYFYGFEQRAESIPLTRSKQERNLAELSEWVDRIRKLKLGDIDEAMLARAFTTCHSSAEVYRTEAVERVFGKLEKLDPKTLASLAQTMRANLAGIWRDPGEQEKKKTKRKQKDIEAEVKRGYEVALQTVESGLHKFPDHYALLCAKAALLHDQLTYEQDIERAPDFTPRRKNILALFAKAADRYGKVLGGRTLTEDEESTEVYDLWFYAGLGAVDLGMITEDRLPDLKQPALIRQAMTSLPPDIGKRHMDKFANNLFTRLSAVKPHVKFRYLSGGFDIVDRDHKQAVEARKVFDYYKDLVTEIKLDARIDGADAVGHGQPFGVFIDLRHTRDIERESGGFGRYLQNQNSLNFSYNYGRPTADYRERFEKLVKDALKEHFDVMSITFQSESVHSRADSKFGWRITPYAYLLLKARGPQVDVIPPVRLDLDFLDTSGYVVLPVETPALPIDCKAGKPQARPIAKLQIIQTLDERQADKGKLILEIKADALGLIGPLEEVLTIDVPGFEIKKTEDNGVNVSKFAEDTDRIAVVSERTWTVTLQAQEGLSERPKAFHFGLAKIDGDVTYQRYRDADVEKVGSTIDLEHGYGEVSWSRSAWLAGSAAVGIGACAIIGTVVWLRRRRQGPSQAVLPNNLTPFTAIDFLSRIRSNPLLTAAQRTEIDQAIAAVEECYFDQKSNGQQLDLRETLRRWTFAAAPAANGATKHSA